MTLPDAFCRRIYAGESPLKVWREYLGFDHTQLMRASGLKMSRLREIEAGKRPSMTKAEARKLGLALEVPGVELMPHYHAYRGCAALDVDEEAILAQEEDRP